jgi:adenylate kinase
MRIILLGAPGAGKGTQAKLISKNFKIPHISTGDIFRANIIENTNLGKKVKSLIEQGQLVPDELTNEIVAKRLAKEDCCSGFLLDGFPRNECQAEELDFILAKDNKVIDKVFYIEVSKQALLERVEGRRFCNKCGSSYHVKFNPSKLNEDCECCGDHLVQRKDDASEVVLERLNIYYKTITPVINYYAHTGILYNIQGGEGINMIFSKISKILKHA